MIIEKIGIIGQGFVGTAVKEVMKNHFNVLTYDKYKLEKSTASSLLELISETSMSFLCVPTPMKKNGKCDISIIESILHEINLNCDSTYLIILKSTVPPSTTEQLNKKFKNLRIVFNPEFLTEANSIADYKNQSRIILGGNESDILRVSVIFNQCFPKIPIIKTSSKIAEMVKYVTNTFLATKVSYANEIYQICEKLNINYEEVINFSKYDNRLGQSHWSVPGPDGDFGYGGHCFPKDIAALKFIANELDIVTTILDAVVEKNNEVRTNLDWTKQIGRAVSDN